MVAKYNLTLATKSALWDVLMKSALSFEVFIHWPFSAIECETLVRHLTPQENCVAFMVTWNPKEVMQMGVW